MTLLLCKWRQCMLLLEEASHLVILVRSVTRLVVRNASGLHSKLSVAPSRVFRILFISN